MVKKRQQKQIRKNVRHNIDWQLISLNKCEGRLLQLYTVLKSQNGKDINLSRFLFFLKTASLLFCPPYWKKAL